MWQLAEFVLGKNVCDRLNNATMVYCEKGGAIALADEEG